MTQIFFETKTKIHWTRLDIYNRFDSSVNPLYYCSMDHTVWWNTVFTCEPFIYATHSTMKWTSGTNKIAILTIVFSKQYNSVGSTQSVYYLIVFLLEQVTVPELHRPLVHDIHLKWGYCNSTLHTDTVVLFWTESILSISNISPLFISEFQVFLHWNSRSSQGQNIFDSPLASLSSFFFVNSRILFEIIRIFFICPSFGSSTKSKSNFADSNSLILEKESARRIRTLFLFFKMDGNEDSKSRASVVENIAFS